MTEVQSLLEEDAFVSFGYAHAVKRLMTNDMETKEIIRDKKCRHIWFVVRGVAKYMEGGRKDCTTGTMLRDFAQRRLDKYARRGERHARADIILGVIHVAGVLTENKTERGTFIRFDNNHRLVKACFK